MSPVPGSMMIPYSTLNFHMLLGNDNFSNSKIGSRGIVGLYNLGNTCYLNSILQMLYNCNLFRLSVIHSEFRDQSVGLALQKLFRCDVILFKLICNLFMSSVS